MLQGWQLQWVRGSFLCLRSMSKVDIIGFVSLSLNRFALDGFRGVFVYTFSSSMFLNIPLMVPWIESMSCTQNSIQLLLCWAPCDPLPPTLGNCAMQAAQVARRLGSVAISSQSISDKRLRSIVPWSVGKNGWHDVPCISNQQLSFTDLHCATRVTIIFHTGLEALKDMHCNGSLVFNVMYRSLARNLLLHVKQCLPFVIIPAHRARLPVVKSLWY